MAIELLEMVLERMEKINGPKEYCRYPSYNDCPNHKIMQKIREYLLRENGKERG
jgi:hypothetical protein